MHTYFFEMLNKIGFLFKPFLFVFASLFFDALYHGCVLISCLFVMNCLFLVLGTSDLYREGLESHAVIRKALYFQNRWYLGIEQLCFFAVDFTLQSQVCLASALFLTIKWHRGSQVPL